MTGAVTIRLAYPDDGAAVARLAALDSRRVPPGPLLLAEIDGEPWAAIAIDGGAVIADPFRPTAALVDLLRAARAQPGWTQRPARSSARRQSASSDWRSSSPIFGS